MSSQDERMRETLEIKEHLLKRELECKEELEYIRRNIAILDSFLVKFSFTRASEMGASPAPKKPAAAPSNAKPITAGSRTIAHSVLATDELRIIMEDGVNLTSATPPLQTFFVERIIGGMRTKDETSVQGGSLDADSVIECAVREDAGRISEISVRNYRTPQRADEIISSVSWTLERMLEKSG